MSVYSSAVDAYRDTTKWLTTLVPVTALGTAAVVVGPLLVQRAQGASSVQAWFLESWLLLLCTVLLFLAVGLILWSATRVLSTEPQGIAQMADPDGASSALASAIGSGVTEPEFFTKDAFDQAMSELAHAWDKGEVVADDPRLTRSKAAVEALREWSMFRSIQAPYKAFQAAFIVSSVVILGTAILIPSQLSTAIAISQPTRVAIGVSVLGADALREATDCTAPEASTYLAVGGSWERPVLAVDGPGCRFGAIWRPTPDQVEVRLP